MKNIEECGFTRINPEDYIVKPFNPMELKVRIKKIIE